MMSHYGDFYDEVRAREGRLLKKYLPKWAEAEDYRIKVEIAEGRAAQEELREIKSALNTLKRALRYRGEEEA